MADPVRSVAFHALRAVSRDDASFDAAGVAS